MSTRPSLLSAVALAALLISAATPSLAQSTDEQFEKGVAAYEDGQFESAAKIWAPLAQNGDPEALRNLAQLYRLGLGVEKDDERAFRLYKRAAEKNSVEAQVNTAFLLLIGEGVDKNPEDAAIWFAKAADQGDAMAQFNLGLMYEKGVGVDPDPTIARELYQLAANQGQERALDRLDALESELPPDGGANARKEADAKRDEERQKAEIKRARERAVEQDEREKEKSETAKKEDDESTMPIMSIKRSSASKDDETEDSEQANEKKPEAGTKITTKTPSAKPPRTSNNTNTTQSLPANSPVGRIKLAEQSYKSGDFAKAASLIKPLSDQGMPIAQFWMGRMFNRGEGVKLDRLEAYSLWRSAAASGSSRAATALANLSNRFTPQEIAFAEQHHAKTGRAR